MKSAMKHGTAGIRVSGRRSVNLHQGQSSIFLLLVMLLVPPASAQRPAPSAPDTPPAVQSDNYIALRAKQIARLDAEKKERDERKRIDGALPEDQYELAFARWDRYWRDHLDSGSHQPGKMADMTRHLRDYHELGQSARNNSLTALATSLICPSAGLGNWTSLGPSTYPAPIMGKVTSVYFDGNNPNTAYAGASEGGLFKTVNNGASWTNLTDSSHYPALGISGIAVDPGAPATIYIGTRNGPPGGGVYGFGILKSIDGGTTWNEIFTLAPFNNQTNYTVAEGSMVSKIMLHPQDSSTLYALAGNYVFRLSGGIWTKVLEITLPPSVPLQNPDGCGYHPIDIDIIKGQTGVGDSAVLVSTVRTAWLGLTNSPCGSARSFLSTNGGTTFTEVAPLGADPTDRIGATVQPGNDADFFIGYKNLATSNFVIKKYNVAGGTVTPVGVSTNGMGAGFWDLEMEFSKLDPTTLYIAGMTLQRASLTNGYSDAPISSYWATDPGTCAPLNRTHADVRTMLVGRIGTKDAVILGTDGGIHKAILDPATVYTPTTANWQDLTGPGLAINEFFDINGIESAPDVLVGGTQDNGTFEYNNGVWRQRENFDGWQGTMNQLTGVYFGMTNGGAIEGQIGTAGTFAFMNSPPIGNGPVVSDPNNAATIYGGSAAVYRSANFGAGWTTLPVPPGNANIRTIQVAPSNSNVLYVAREGQTWNPNDLTKHLFRSNNSGTTWTDIGVNLPPLAWAGISDIAVDPDDANRLWISFNGYWATSNTSTNGANRVWFSVDAGNTWSDLTFNLMAFPVASLVYQRGSDDVLYASTDVGVFRFNKALLSWECFNNQLPISPVTRMEINYCKNKIRASTAGRGVYESDLPPLPSELITASVTWAGVRYLSNDLTIASGAALTLTGTLNMGKDRRIIVQRGATLNVNGGRITNCCGDMWHGIDLWGTASAAQNLSAAQGKVIVQNGAKIENAVDAITTGRDVNGLFDWSYTGGIVTASNSSFLNNRRSIQFMYYHWMNGAIEISNLGKITNCTFETNRRLNDPTQFPNAHITLYEVTNVNILGCRFTNTASINDFSVNGRGDGIHSYDAQYKVDDLFNTIISPPTLIAASAFTGLTYGVSADFTAGVAKHVRISNSDFNNVQRGVRVTNSIASFIGGNAFNALPNALTSGFAAATWGVRMVRAASMAVRGNTITGASSAYQNDYGIIIEDCGPSSNVVQGNTLANLYTGIQAVGANGTGAAGVQFRCNIFNPAMSYQIAVQAGGALADQGTTACTLGNTADNTFFAQAAPAGSQINSTAVTFKYFASGTTPTNVAGPVTVTTCSNVSGECVSGNTH